MANLIKITKDENYDYKWSIDGNKYGDTYDITSAGGFGDTNLVNQGWEEVLAVNGGLFYTYENKHYACGLEKSRGTNNQELEMSCVTDYNSCMSIACVDSELYFASQEWIIKNKLDSAYGAITGMGLLLEGKAKTDMHKGFETQWNQVSGRTIIGEDKDGNFLSYSIKGTTGTSGITGDQAVKVAQENGFHNAIMLDGGGSVWRRYFGAYDITTTRKVKNALILYRKKKDGVASTSSDAPVFTERLSSTGIKGNKYWYDTNYNKGASSSGTMLPNCTCYVVGRACEIAGQACKIFPKRSAGGFPDAKGFYSESDWVGSAEPVVGGIICWGASTDKYGHVAICERVLGQTSAGWKILVSQSNYGGTFFETKEYTVKKGVKTSGVGYIYNGCLHNPYINDIRVSRDTVKNQVEVLVDKLKVRTSANGEELSGRFIAQGTYNVIEFKEAGSYTWAKLAADTWIATNDNEGWTKTYYIEKETPTTDSDLEKQIEELKAQLETANNNISSLKKEKEELTTKNSELTTQANEAKEAEELAENKVSNYKEIIEAVKIILDRTV